MNNPNRIWATLAIVAYLASSPVTAQISGDLSEKYGHSQWDRIPLNSEDPTAGFRLCEKPHEDSCTVLSEMWIDLPSGKRSPVSLDDLLAKWIKESRGTIIDAPMRTTVGKYAAVQMATQSEHSDHFHQIVVHSTIVYVIDGTFVRCHGWSEPAEYFVFSQAFHDFCASYDISQLKSG